MLLIPGKKNISGFDGSLGAIATVKTVARNGWPKNGSVAGMAYRL